MLPSAWTIGPFVISAGLLVLALAVLAGQFAGRRAGRRDGVDPEPALWWALLLGLLVARGFYVWSFHDAYLAAPWSIVDVRDGGWEPVAGLAAAWLWGTHRGALVPALKRPLRVGLAAGTVVWFAGTVAAAVVPVGERPTLPALTLESLDGQAVALAGYAGRPVVVNLWATWCPPCVREMPLLQQAQQANADVHVVFVNQGEAAATVQGWLSRRGMPLREVLIDRSGRMGAAVGHRALPTTLFFDAQGRLVSTRVGELSRATLEERLAKARGGR